MQKTTIHKLRTQLQPARVKSRSRTESDPAQVGRSPVPIARRQMLAPPRRLPPDGLTHIKATKPKSNYLSP